MHWGRLYGAASALAVAEAACERETTFLLITPTARAAEQLHDEIGFFSSDRFETRMFQDLETLPYDSFTAHPDITSSRLSVLASLPHARRGVWTVSIDTLLQRLAPRSYIEAHSLSVAVGAPLDLAALRARLSAAGYSHVTQVVAHGEFAVRGSIIDVFPMGTDQPLRIDLLDREIESIRQFDPDTQRSGERLESIRLLPARETPLDESSVQQFRRRYRARFEGDLSDHVLYREVSRGVAPGGIDYFLPLFFERTSNLFDYLPPGSILIDHEDALAGAADAFKAIEQRHGQLAHDRLRPLLDPAEVFLRPEELAQTIASLPCIRLRQVAWPPGTSGAVRNFPCSAPAEVRIDTRAEVPVAILLEHLRDSAGRVLLAAESAGRRELMLDLLRPHDIVPAIHAGFEEFLTSDACLGICVSPGVSGLKLETPPLEILTEAQLFGERARQERRRKRSERDPARILRELTDLSMGSPVVHESYGVGRYAGLITMEVAGHTGEFLTLTYADGDRLYVPVQSLHLVSRYTGASPDSAPLHKLGGEQWARARRKAAQRIRDVAAELLDLYARRAARAGTSLDVRETEYQAFQQAFPFEETADQASAIEAVIADLKSGKPMDRVVCGDVGFGKTEVAMRAAFVAVQAGKQVAVLVPTTLLAQQHFATFGDRFADWPVRIESLSRFRSSNETRAIIAGIGSGSIDIVVATQKLLAAGVKFRDLGLIIIDEEHRFGVRDKERLKALRAEVDVLTLTATPIPRTLNMAMGGLRDLSLITTPPAERLAVKTFVTQWDDNTIRDAGMREIRRGGQIYFVHNSIETIQKTANALKVLLPEAGVRIGHGQMRERELEQLMLDFYHRRFNLLVCTTIIESGIDVPTANTIIIDRADRFGLAQLHQLRGRVGRSHHRAYAYLLTPPRAAMTADAVKRLEALESLEELGAGFTLATHDLEIRGAGELLGEEQSGQIQELGFNLYMDLLERAVSALKAGRVPDLEGPLNSGTEIELPLPALIPEDYVADIHLRLVLYKRIAGVDSDAGLEDLKTELIDRFGELPTATQTLFRAAQIRLAASRLGIRKINMGVSSGYLEFDAQHQVDPRNVLKLVQAKPREYRLDGPSKLRFAHEARSEGAVFAKLRQLLEVLGS